MPHASSIGPNVLVGPSLYCSLPSALQTATKVAFFICIPPTLWWISILWCLPIAVRIKAHSSVDTQGSSWSVLTISWNSLYAPATPNDFWSLHSPGFLIVPLCLGTNCSLCRIPFLHLFTCQTLSHPSYFSFYHTSSRTPSLPTLHTRMDWAPALGISASMLPSGMQISCCISISSGDRGLLSEHDFPKISWPRQEASAVFAPDSKIVCCRTL